MLAPWKKNYDQLRQCIQKQSHYFANKCPYSQRYSFYRSHAWLWELDHKESWALKNWCFWTVVLEKTLESPLDWKEIKLANPKENKPWIFIGGTDAEAEALILWPPYKKSQLTGKEPNAGQDWGRRRRGGQEDKMVACHHPQWTWVWASSRRWWRTGKPGMRQSMGSQRARHDWETELNWTEGLSILPLHLFQSLILLQLL